MSNRYVKWNENIAYLKECVLSDGQGDLKRISDYLQKLSDQELWEIEAFLQMGQNGVPDFEAVLDAQIEQLGKDPREDVIRTICSKSNNIGHRLEGIEIIRNGK